MGFHHVSGTSKDSNAEGKGQRYCIKLGNDAIPEHSKWHISAHIQSTSRRFNQLDSEPVLNSNYPSIISLLVIMVFNVTHGGCLINMHLMN